MMNWCRNLLLAVIAITFTSHADSVDTGNDIIRADIPGFTRAVFGNGNVSGSTSRVQQPCLVKWQQGFQLVISGESSPDQDRTIRQAVHEFTALTGLKADGSNQGTGQLTFVVKQDLELSGANYKSRCAASRNHTALCEITRATVRVPANLDSDRFGYCVYHELMHAFGFQGHAWNLQSILNPSLDLIDLTEWDKSALKFIYGRDVAVGASIRQARRALIEGD